MVQSPADQTIRRDMDLVGTHLTAAKVARTTRTSGILDPLLAPLVMLLAALLVIAVMSICLSLSFCSQHIPSSEFISPLATLLAGSAPVLQSSLLV